jgi:hypothetical protein
LTYEAWLTIQSCLNMRTKPDHRPFKIIPLCMQALTGLTVGFVYFCQSQRGDTYIRGCGAKGGLPYTTASFGIYSPLRHLLANLDNVRHDDPYACTGPAASDFVRKLRAHKPNSRKSWQLKIKAISCYSPTFLGNLRQFFLSFHNYK